MVFLIIKALLIVLSTLFVAVLLIQIIGYLLPRRIHVVTTRSYFQNAEILQRILGEIEGYPDWKPTVQNATPIESNRWKEQLTGQYELNYQTEPQQHPDQIHVTTVGKQMPFQLQRTYKTWRQDHMAFLQVEDVLIINKPYLRALGSLFYNHKAFATAELQALDDYMETKFGSAF